MFPKSTPTTMVPFWSTTLGTLLHRVVIICDFILMHKWKLSKGGSNDPAGGRMAPRIID